MSHMLLEILAEETLKGNKPSSTFKAESFVKVATKISQKFNVQCEPKYVGNHLKTVKKEWGIITKLKNKIGMIAMTIIVGKDMATRNYAKSYADVNLEENAEEQSISIENEGEYEETSKEKETSSSSAHKQGCQFRFDDGVEKLSKKIADVVFAIQNLSKNQLDVNELYTKVMKIEGFDEITLGDAFDHLVQHEMLAKAFMTKNANFRKIWVQNFVNQHYYRPDC
ncbi:hypothetical protein POPTR_004G108960v4 [Populus trichocarpa]|uniref:Uncharacterized protein n=1 Tax=Populus trichocarpa TaxID=3694 RepID=A0ACC0T438_POPTR|nr:hypothetical protein POPTR_004G108960v4 [Populus trichocarpa]